LVAQEEILQEQFVATSDGGPRRGDHYRKEFKHRRSIAACLSSLSSVTFALLQQREFAGSRPVAA
jgi:hypothetical protein